MMQRLVDLGWGGERARCCVHKLQEALKDATGELEGPRYWTPDTSATLHLARWLPHMVLVS